MIWTYYERKDDSETARFFMEITIQDKNERGRTKKR